MDFHILISNLTNPTILFFLLGILATTLKSDLEIPQSSSKFISLYLLFSIGFKGGQELVHSHFTSEIIFSVLLGISISAIIPFYTFFLLKRKLSISDAGAIAATYGSVSAVTFVSAVSFLEIQKMAFGGHMVAVMAFMEAPAIIVGVTLIKKFEKDTCQQSSNMWQIIKHSFSNGSILMIFGSLIIGIVSDDKQAEGIKPFTTDIFKGFLAIFLLEMGMITARRFASFRKQGLFLTLLAIFLPAFNGIMSVAVSSLITHDVGNRFMFGVLAASGSYIAVPATMKLAAPNADPGIYVPMALGLTFPFNISVGFPLYFAVANAI